MKIGILSDTHGVIPDQFLTELTTCEYIIHAGDVGTERCYNQLKSLDSHLYIVRGNCDIGGWAKYIPETLAFRIDGITFYLIHNRSHLPYDVPETDYVVYGHTHIYNNEKHRDTTYLNPGSAGNCWGDQTSMMILNTEKASGTQTYDIRKVTLK